MKTEDVIKEIDEIYGRRIALAKAKGHDYAGETDFFRCFEQSASIAGISVAQTMVWEIALKIIRVSNVLKFGNMVGEDVFETLTDISNYVDYLHIYLKTKQSKEKR